MADETKEGQSPPKKKLKIFRVFIIIILVMVAGATAAFYLNLPGFKKVTGMSSQVLRMKMPTSKPSPNPSEKPSNKTIVKQTPTVKQTPRRPVKKAAIPQKSVKSPKVKKTQKSTNPIKITAKQNNSKPPVVASSHKVVARANVATGSRVATVPVRSSTAQSDIDYGFEMRRVETFLENDIGNANAIYNRGWLNERGGNLVSAQDDYSNAIKINSRLADAYFNRGLILIDMKKYEQAAQDFSEVIKMEPRAVDAYCNRGNAYFNLGKNDSALRDYEAALEMDPNDADLYFNRAIVLLDKGDESAAMADFRKALNLGLDKASDYLKSSASETPRIATSAPPQKTPRTSTPSQTAISTSSTTTAPSAPHVGSAGGKIHGVDFQVEQAGIANGILTLRQGSDFFPDYAVLVFLFLKEGETAEGRAFNITKEQGFGSPHIHMKWKQKGQNPPKTEIFMKDYTMRLQFGKRNDNVLPGKISLSLPDKDQSFVNGSFFAEIK